MEEVKQDMSSITYFYKDGCPYSKKAHNLVREQFGGRRDFAVKAICVDGNPHHYKQQLSHFCGKEISTFPQIFVNNNHVGGYSDLESLVGKKSGSYR